MKIAIIFIFLLDAFLLPQRSVTADQPPDDDIAGPSSPSSVNYDEPVPNPSPNHELLPVEQPAEPAVSQQEEQKPDYEPEKPDIQKVDSDPPTKDDEDFKPREVIPRPRFTPRPTTATSTPRPPALIELEDIPTKPVSTNLLKIPKFDLPTNLHKIKSNVEIVRGREGSGFKESKARNIKSGRGGGGGGGGGSPAKIVKSKPQFLQGDNSAPLNPTTKSLMVGVAIFTVFAAVLLIFLLTFMLMDRIVCLA